MKVTALIIILVNSLVNAVPSQAPKLEADQLQECCADGSRNGNLDIDCSNSYKPNPELGPLDRKCFEAFWKCCVNKQASLYCDKGKALAVQDGHCNAARPALKPSGEPVPGGGMLPECCRLCHEGRYLASCPAEAGPSLPERALHQCCQDDWNDRHFGLEDGVCSWCQHECSPSREHCTCHDGFQLAEDGHSCGDINECLEANICKEGEECANYHGTYECILLLPLEDTCDDGAIFNAKTNKCEKVSSEARDNHHFEFEDEDMCSSCEQVCWPSEDRCACVDGFELAQDGHSCHDVDECLRTNVCKEAEVCVNYHGGYECLSTTFPGLTDGATDADDDTVEDHECSCKSAALVLMASAMAHFVTLVLFLRCSNIVFA
ncbi:Hemicentin-1 [Halotydeus destructor]|nr:Hemicentin-1 [Halotydeus destructor]